MLDKLDRFTELRRDRSLGSQAVSTVLSSQRAGTLSEPARLGKSSPAFIIKLLFDLEERAAKIGWVGAMEQAGRTLRAARTLSSFERRFAGEALHGVVRGLRRLRVLCGGKRPTAAQLYAAWLLDEGLASPSERSRPEVAGILARQTALDERLDHLPALSADEQMEAIGEALSYPSWLVREFIADLGIEQTLDVLLAQNQRAPLTVRVNSQRTDRQAVSALLKDEGLSSLPTAHSPHGLIVEGHINIYATRAFADGLIEIQDEGSQLIAEVCAPPPGGVVVDVCAGAGGKTLALGALLGNKGRIVAMDIDGRKLEELQKRTRRAGLCNVQSVRLPLDWAERGTASLPDWLLSRGADRVLVDAPCSGLGVLRRHAEARWQMQPQSIAEIVKKQRAILGAAAAFVKPHGRLIYATCTLLRRENDAAIESFLAEHKSFAPVSIKEILGGERATGLADDKWLRLQPTPGGPDGFFAAVLRRGAS